MEYLKTAAQTAKKNADTLYNGTKGKRGAIFNYSLLNSADFSEELKSKIIESISEMRFFKESDILTDFETMVTESDDERVYIYFEFERTAIYNTDGDKKYIAFNLTGLEASFYRLNCYGEVYADEMPSHTIKIGKSRYTIISSIYDYTLTA